MTVAPASCLTPSAPSPGHLLQQNCCKPKVTATVVASSSRFDIECREVGLVGKPPWPFFLSRFLGGQVWIGRLGSPMVAIACRALQMAIMFGNGN